MKTKQKVAILALAALITGTSHAAITGKSSGFMDKRQLAAWRAETVSKSAEAESNDPAFFTGKPFLSSTDTYAFKFRSYDPSMARWSSEDPSGFPDGSNGSSYAPCVTSEIDPLGLFLSGTTYSSELSDKAIWLSLKAVATTLTGKSMDHADGTIGGDWTLSDSEISIVRSDFSYENKFIPSVQALLGRPPSVGAFSTEVNHLLFKKPSDSYYALGEADLSTKGTVSEILDNYYKYDAEVTLFDHYSFSGYKDVPFYTPTALGYRLQSHGFIRAFDTHATWQANWYVSE